MKRLEKYIKLANDLDNLREFSKASALDNYIETIKVADMGNKWAHQSLKAAAEHLIIATDAIAEEQLHLALSHTEKLIGYAEGVANYLKSRVRKPSSDSVVIASTDEIEVLE